MKNITAALLALALFVHDATSFTATHRPVATTRLVPFPRTATTVAATRSTSNFPSLLRASNKSDNELQQQQQQPEEEEEELSETKKLLQKVKAAGLAGTISYALWELAFWTISFPICVVGFREISGHWPDLSNGEDMQKVGAEAFAFVNFARFAVPLRIGLALSTTGWIDENLVKKYIKKEDGDAAEE